MASGAYLILIEEASLIGEVLQAGSFGGTYFRPIYSSVTKVKYGKEVWQELPSDWLEGLDIRYLHM